MAVMDAAWELGITHFDTADAYGGGRSERAIGRWMAARGVRPTLTTKTFNPMSEDGDHGLAPERVRRQLDSSLERLGVESVELYLAHDHDPEVPLGESLAAFSEAVTSGRAGAYGVSNFNAAQLEEALAAGAPAAVQNSCSLLEQGDLGGRAAAVRATLGVLPGVQPAGRRLADRQVPPRRALSGGLANDPATRAVRRPGRRRSDLRRARGAGAVRRRARNVDGRGRAGVAAGRPADRPGGGGSRPSRAPGAGARGAGASARRRRGGSGWGRRSPDARARLSATPTCTPCSIPTRASGRWPRCWPRVPAERRSTRCGR